MPELRRNIVTDEWVIIATERVKRPEDFSDKNKNVDNSNGLSYKENCPFCKGNEALTPPEIYTIRKDADDISTWEIRVVPNKFPALTSEGENTRTTIGIYEIMSGVGEHEVIIETSEHDKNPALLDEKAVSVIVDTYVKRYKDISQKTDIKYVQIFRNHGKIAGASLEHPHSQIIATPVIPDIVQRKFDIAKRYYENTCKCIMCDVISEEKRDTRRIIFENEDFLVFEPFASKVPFETWIVPKRHDLTFEHINGLETKSLGHVLSKTLRAIYKGLSDPAYNMVICTLPTDQTKENYYMHWYIQIIPRLTITAGFEMGTGIYINVTTPEDTAYFLRCNIEK